MESSQFHADLALLDWQIDLGATEAIADAPVNRYELPAALEKPKAAKPAAVVNPRPAAAADPVAIAKAAATAAQSLEELKSGNHENRSNSTFKLLRRLI